MLIISPIFNAMVRNKSSVVLIIFQIALTLAIVSNAAFIIQERISDMQRDTGIPESQVVNFTMFFFDEDVDVIKQLELDAQQLKKMPGVIEATAVNQVPLSGSGDSWMVRNQLESEGAITVGSANFRGGSSLINMLGQKVSRGRNFRPEEVTYLVNGNEMPKVTIITQALAETLFPEEDALGKTVYIMNNPLQVIGIVDKMQGPWVHSTLVEYNMFIAMLRPSKFTRFGVLVEKDQVDNVMANVQDYLLALENRRVVNTPSTIAQQKASSYQNDRLMTNMLFIIIVVLAFITALGIAGMTIFNVNRRQKQIGTRRALGASKGDILSYFMTESAIIAAIGISLGVVLALVLNNYLMTFFDSNALSFSYILMTILGIVVVVGFSVLLPARKASLISPAIATRSV
ncbi:MAG: ABC transporter permease [Thalassotalea sp.]